MNNCKFILIPSADSPAHVSAKFTKGKRYEAEPFASHVGTTLYSVIDDKGKAYTINPKASYHIGGAHFSVEMQMHNVCSNGSFATGGYVKDLLKYPQQTSESMFGSITTTNFPLFITEVKDRESAKKAEFESLSDSILKIVLDDISNMRNDRISAVDENGKVRVTMGDLRTKEQKLADRVKDLESELSAAHNTIAKIRDAMRTPEGEDAQQHAKVLRQMADALVNLWRNGQ
ncbi:putative Eaa-like family protein [Klebsiella phage vB_KpnS-VAC2]|uniref:Eaa-like family protein n=1 Tax=Klebsiella phage vB_KpnS-VAC2 TaxID=2864369 RepID=A0AAE8BXT6_9CAUD|nr:putative Eaa-like family protein [Klebsiella phage vB_KpnS-VAC2]